MAGRVVGQATVELKMDYKNNLKKAVQDIQQAVGKVSLEEINKKNAQAIGDMEKKIRDLEDALKKVDNVAKQSSSSGGGIAGFQKQLLSVSTRIFSVTTAIRAMRKAVQLFVASVREFAKFDSQLRTTSIIADDTGKSFGRLRDTMFELSRAPLTVNIEKMNQSMYKLASAGLDATEIMQVLPEAIQTSVGVSEDLDKSIQLLVSTVNGFNLDFSKSPEIMDLFARAVANSQATIEKLGVGLARVAPIAEQLNIDLETTVGVFSKLVDTGLSASRSGTVLVNTFKGLSSFTPKSEKAIERLGLAVQDVDLQFNSLDEALERLAQTDFTDSDLQDIFGTRGKLISGILNNIKQGQRLQDIVNDITGTGGKEVFSEAQLDSLNQSITRMENALTELRLTSIELTSGTMIKALDSVAGYVNEITDMLKGVQNLFDSGRGIQGAIELTSNVVPKVNPFIGDGVVGDIFRGLGRALGNVQQNFTDQRNTRNRNANPTSEADEMEAQAEMVVEAQRRSTRAYQAIGAVLTANEQSALAQLEAQNIIKQKENEINAQYDERARLLAQEVQAGGDIEDYSVKITALQEERKDALARAILEIGEVSADSDNLSGVAKGKIENLRVNVGEFIDEINEALVGEKSGRASDIIPKRRGENIDKYYRSVLANVTNAQKDLRNNLQAVDDFYSGLSDLAEVNPQIFNAKTFDDFIEAIPEMYKNLFGLNSEGTRDLGLSLLGSAYDASADPEIKKLIENRQREAGILLFESVLGSEGLSDIYGDFEQFKDFAQIEASGVSEEYANRIYQQINQVESFIVGRLAGYEKAIAQANLLEDTDISKSFQEIEDQIDLLPNALEKVTLVMSNLANAGDFFDEEDVLSQLTDAERGALSNVNLQQVMEDVFSKSINPKSAEEISKQLLGHPKVVEAQIQAIQAQSEENQKVFDEYLKRSDLTPEQRKYVQDLKDLNDSKVIETLADNFQNLNEVLPTNAEKIASFTNSFGNLLSQLGQTSGNDYLSNLGSSLSGFGDAFKTISSTDFGNLDFTSLDGLQGAFSSIGAGVQVGGLANALLGQESNLASTLLSGVGTAVGGVLGGGIGAVAGGALGGAIGGLFGGSDSNKAQARERERQALQQQATKDFADAVDQFVNAIEDSGIEQAFENLAEIATAPTDEDQIKAILDAGRFGSDNITADALREVLPQFSDTEIRDLIRSTLGAGNITNGGNAFDTGYGTRGGFNTTAFASEVARINEEMGDALTKNLVNSLDIATSKFQSAFSSTLLTGDSLTGEFESIISGAYQNAITNTSTVVSFSEQLQKLLIGDIENVINDATFGLSQAVPQFQTVEEALAFMQEYSDNANEALDEIIDKYGLVGLKIDKINAELEFGLIKLQGEGASQIEQNRFELQKYQEQLDLIEEGTQQWYETLKKVKDIEEEIYDTGVKIARTQEDTNDIRNLITTYEAEAKAIERLYEDLAVAKERNDSEQIADLEKQIAQLEEAKAQSIKNSLTSAVVSGLSDGITEAGALDFDSIGDTIRKSIYQAQLDNIIESILSSSEINEAINQLTREVEEGNVEEAEATLDLLLGLIDGSLEGFEEQIKKIEEILGADANTDPIVFFDEQNLDDALRAVDSIGQRELEQQQEEEKIVRILLTKDGGDLTEEELARLAEIITRYGLQVDTSKTN